MLKKRPFFLAAGQNTLWTTLTVAATLAFGFVVTGIASSAYHRERGALGIEHHQRGQTLESSGKLEPALEEYRKALFFSPDKTEYRLSLVRGLVEAGRLDEAQSHLEQLLQDDPTNPPINLLLGQVAVKQGNLKQAVEDYQRAVYEYWPEADLPKRRQARWELANLLKQTGDRSGSIAELVQLYTNTPRAENPKRLRVGWLLLQDGATAEASRVFQELAKQMPQSAEARRGLGEAYFDSGEYVSARHEFQRALRMDAKDPNSQEMLALTEAVIEMDPALPSTTSVEQLRRSTNLLTRVWKHLEACGAPTNATIQRPAVDTPSQELLDAKALLQAKQTSYDKVIEVQRAAEQLWNDKTRLCRSQVPVDRALDTVFTRIGGE